MRIDSHHHFWNYSPEAYPWIGGDMAVLKRDFAPADLKPLLDEFKIDGVVSVQARTEEAENEFLLQQAAEHDWILGVVGWLDLTADDAAEKVARFAEKPKAVGLREVLQGMPERDYCLREDFNRGLSVLHDFGLTYDLLIYADQLEAAIQCVDRHSAQPFVLDHIAKPVIGGPGGVDVAWATSIGELAKREHVFCKVSGMITEVIPALEDWDPDLLGPWFDVVLEAFGPDRLMFGSDWPVCLLRGEYADWMQCVEFWVSGLSQAEQTAILGENAKRFYGLG
jgi:L-fuconolactonase